MLAEDSTPWRRLCTRVLDRPEGLRAVLQLDRLSYVAQVSVATKHQGFAHVRPPARPHSRAPGLPVALKRLGILAMWPACRAGISRVPHALHGAEGDALKNERL